MGCGTHVRTQNIVDPWPMSLATMIGASVSPWKILIMMRKSRVGVFCDMYILQGAGDEVITIVCKCKYLLGVGEVVCVIHQSYLFMIIRCAPPNIQLFRLCLEWCPTCMNRHDCPMIAVIFMFCFVENTIFFTSTLSSIL